MSNPHATLATLATLLAGVPSRTTYAAHVRVLGLGPDGLPGPTAWAAVASTDALAHALSVHVVNAGRLDVLRRAVRVLGMGQDGLAGHDTAWVETATLAEIEAAIKRAGE